MDAVSLVPVEAVLPENILDIWVVVITLAIIVIMTSLLLYPATAVIIYCMRTHPVLSGTENLPRGVVRDMAAKPPRIYRCYC
uniref:Small integral membrane protein 3 n=1 Tax=Suricata suricatta TaxID=37032 RepID=A0A673V542_SURSU